MIKKIGHRGAKGYVVENTIESFKKALALGVDGVELDVQLCKSGEVVVFHDFTIDRLTQKKGAKANYTWAELNAIYINGTYKIPTLTEVLQVLDNKCMVNIELKGKNTATPVFKLLSAEIESNRWQPFNFLISSFQYKELEEFKSFQSKIPLAVLTQASVEQAIEWAIHFKAKAIHPHFSLLTEDNCIKAKEMGLQVNTWTVNTTDEINALKRCQIDGIISDFPDTI